MQTVPSTRLLSLTLAGLLCLAPTAAADTSAPGFEIDTLPMPTGVSGYGTVTCTLPGGDLVTFDGTSVERWTAAGGFVQTLGTLTTGGYAAFVLPTPDGSGVAFAHSGDFFAGVAGELFTAPLSGAGITGVVQITFAYDAVFLADGDLLVAADLAGSASDTDFVRVDLAARSATPIGRVGGPSGPLALRASGDLYYAPAEPSFPASAGSGKIVYWTAADLAAGTFLDETNWTIWATGYDPISSMRVDPVMDRVFVAENLYDDLTFALLSARVRRARPAVAKAEEIAVAVDSIANLEFVDLGGGAANFQSYQPGNGSNLKYNTTDFFSRADHHAILPKRPTLTASGPGLLGVGAVTLTAVDAPANGTLYLVFGPTAQMSPTEQTYNHPGYLFHTHLSPFSMRRLPFLIPTDASGTGSFTLFNDGSLTGLYGYQYLVGDGTATFLGSTNDLVF